MKNPYTCGSLTFGIIALMYLRCIVLIKNIQHITVLKNSGILNEGNLVGSQCGQSL